MKTCVVYESMFGNTHEIATAIAAGVKHLGETTVGSVAEVSPDVAAAVDLLVVGGPTHVHGMSRTSSRAAAVEQAEADDAIDLDLDAPGPGLREWLAQMPKAPTVHFAAFDTRIDKPVILVGSAAKGITKQLKRRKYSPLTDPESFFVDGSAGPLHAGEVDRARQWGVDLAHELTRISRDHSVVAER